MLHQWFTLIGTPGEEDLGFMMNQDGGAKKSCEPEDIKMIRRFPALPKKNFLRIFADATPEGADLLERILVFNPNSRLTAQQCLEHPFFAMYHDDR